MRGMCVWLREISPGEREIVTSGGEREERQAWTHDINLIKKQQYLTIYIIKTCQGSHI